MSSDLSASTGDSTVAWVEMQHALAVEAFQTSPFGRGLYNVTEEPEIFVGSAGEWSDDGKELPYPKVLIGRRKELTPGAPLV